MRAVSFQQLDINLLTHSHGINRAKKYETISKIIDYKRVEKIFPLSYSTKTK